MNNPTTMTCKECGKAFVTFLEDMAEKNLDVVCPNCWKAHEDGPKVRAGEGCVS